MNKGMVMTEKREDDRAISLHLRVHGDLTLMILTRIMEADF